MGKPQLLNEVFNVANTQKMGSIRRRITQSVSTRKTPRKLRQIGQTLQQFKAAREVCNLFCAIHFSIFQLDSKRIGLLVFCVQIRDLMKWSSVLD